MCCVVVQAQALSYEDLSKDLTLPGMGIETTMWHMRPKPTPRNRRAPNIAFAPVAKEQPLFEEEGEGEEEEEEEMREEEEARTGGSDAQDEGGQAGGRCMGSQFLV